MEPKPLIFNDKPKVSEPQPKPLTFNTPKKETVVGNVSFKENKKTTPRPLFQQQSTPLLEQAITIANSITDINLRERVERQIRQLLDLHPDEIMKWGNSALDDEVDATLSITKIVNQISMLNVGEELEKIHKRVDNKVSFTELFSKPISLDRIRLKLMEFRTSLTKLKQEFDLYERGLVDSEKRLNLFVLSLKTVEEAAKIIGSYDSVENVMYNRRILLVQAIQQAQLTTIQLTQTKQLVQNHLQNIEQLEKITLPAYEASLRK